MNKIQLAFYFDQTRCMSCNACTVSCKDWNQVNPGPVTWRKQFAYEDKGAENILPFSMSCNHCEDPACLTACSVNAISKSDDGIVTVDRNKCESLLACISACPFGKAQVANDKQEPNALVGWKVQHPMQKCDMCKDRLDEGEKPTCVLSCVGRALDHGTLESLQTKYPEAVRVNPGDFPYMYVNNHTDTKPALLVKAKTVKTTVHKSTTYKP